MKTKITAICLSLLIATSAPLWADTASTNWIRLIYADTFDRAPSRHEINALQSSLDTGATPVQVALQVVGSSDFDAITLQQAFQSYLHRPATAREQSLIIGYLQAGTTESVLAATLFGLDEYFSTRAGNDNGMWVDAVYGDVVHRAPTTSERQNFLAFLQQGSTRTSVSHVLITSDEARTITITSIYQSYLRRNPTSAEVSAAINDLSAGLRYDDVRAGILGSMEYITLAQSLAGSLPIAEPPAQSLNISARVQVGTGDEVAIAGFILSGSDPKQVLIRGIGPSLPVPGAVADPVLELHDSNGGTLATNDDWRDSQATAIQATGIPPSNDREAAILVTLPANNAAYTVVLTGRNGGTGIGLVEVYDLAPSANSQPGNMSTRGFVGSNEQVLIGGIILGPNGVGPATLLVRALGPSLAERGVAGTISDPVLELYDGNGVLIAQNDNWKSDQQAEIAATGIAPTNDLESAILKTLTPSAYTVIVRNSNSGTGVGLVEIYNLR